MARVLWKVFEFAIVAMFLSAFTTPSLAYQTAKSGMDREDRIALAQNYIKVWNFNCTQVPILSPSEKTYIKENYNLEVLRKDPKRYLEASNSVALATQTAFKACDGIMTPLVDLEDPKLSSGGELRAWALFSYVLADPELTKSFGVLLKNGVVRKFDCDNSDGTSIEICGFVLLNMAQEIIIEIIVPTF